MFLKFKVTPRRLEKTKIPEMGGSYSHFGLTLTLAYRPQSFWSLDLSTCASTFVHRGVHLIINCHYQGWTLLPISTHCQIRYRTWHLIVDLFASNHMALASTLSYFRVLWHSLNLRQRVVSSGRCLQGSLSETPIFKINLNHYNPFDRRKTNKWVLIIVQPTERAVYQCSERVWCHRVAKSWLTPGFQASTK